MCQERRTLVKYLITFSLIFDCNSCTGLLLLILMNSQYIFMSSQLLMSQQSYFSDNDIEGKQLDVNVKEKILNFIRCV